MCFFLQCWKMQIAAVAPLQHDHPLSVLTDFLKDSAHKMSGFFCSAFRNFPLLKHLPLLGCLGPSQSSGKLLSQGFLTIWALKCHDSCPWSGKWWQLPVSLRLDFTLVDKKAFHEKHKNDPHSISHNWWEANRNIPASSRYHCCCDPVLPLRGSILFSTLLVLWGPQGRKRPLGIHSAPAWSSFHPWHYPEAQSPQGTRARSKPAVDRVCFHKLTQSLINAISADE